LTKTALGHKFLVQLQI